ncbi:MAG: GNAT family N-acetyltransferase [Actinobacteria bacterium]|nr:GNAT family N-acetyltransferase [Actinomycetota bacterium]
MTITVEEVDTSTAPEPVLREMHEHYIGHDAEQLPDDPPMPFEQRVALWRHIPEHQDVRRFVLREDGEIEAVAVSYMDKYEDLNNGFVRIHVRLDARRRGLARTLATPAFDVLEEGDRKSLITDTAARSDWEPKLEALGMKKAYQDKRSRLVVADIDWDLMGAWIEKAEERASGYRLLYLETPIPEEHLENWCAVMDVMNTAPKEDLEFEDTTYTPEKWRDIEEKDMAKGHFMAHVAVDEESGQFVGLSEIIFQKYQPDLAWQGDTGVHPEHRNKGLGRWLKAATIKKVIAEHPEIDRIDTGNAGSNEPMLNINVAMGYKPILITNAWQGDLAVVRERLGA